MFPKRQSDGFSLIELLVVIAIIGLLAAFSIPAFNFIGQARGVTEAGYQVAGAIERARSEAVTRQTYVWLAFQEQTNSGNRDLRLGIVYSRDGSTNSNTNNLQPVGRALLIQRVGLTNSALVPGSPVELIGSTGGISFNIGQSAQFTDKRSITFTPMGEVMTAPAPSSLTPFDPLLAIGFSTAHGTQLETTNIVSVAIDGSVGVPTIYRK